MAVKKVVKKGAKKVVKKGAKKSSPMKLGKEEKKEKKMGMC